MFDKSKEGIESNDPYYKGKLTDAQRKESGLKITHKFEKNEFWSTPIWTVTYDNIDNREIEKNVRELKFDGPGEGIPYGLLLESTFTTQISYASIIKQIYLSLFSIKFNPPLVKINDFKPKFYICQPNGCSSLEHTCMNDRGQEHDITVMYFVKVPKENIPTISFKDPRTLIVGNSFFRDHLDSIEDVQYEPSEGTAVVFPPYLESKVNINLSNEDLIYFKANMSLSLLGDWVNPNE